MSSESTAIAVDRELNSGRCPSDQCSPNEKYNMPDGCFRILDEDGVIQEGQENPLDADKLVELYRSMCLARTVDERLLKLQRQGRIGTFPLSSGQEAAACAATMAMRQEDWWVGAFRELGGRLMRGEPIENIFVYFGGYEEGATFPGGERTLPVSIIIASHTLHAVGITYAMRLKGEKETAAVTFFGDGATSEGDFHEAMNFASVWQVPVVFICLNNQWAISIPREKQTRSKTIAQKAIAYEMPGVQVDGNDPLAMYKATMDALERGRAGEGPTLIEAVTYRQSMHTTADDPKRYRSEDEVAAWMKRDPLIRTRKYLENQGLWNDEEQEKLDAESATKIDEALRKYEAMTEFKTDAPFDHVFGEPHPRIEAQRADFLKNMKEDNANG